MRMTLPVSGATARQAVDATVSFATSVSMSDRRLLEGTDARGGTSSYRYDVAMFRSTAACPGGTRSAHIISLRGNDGDHVVIAVY